MSLFCHYNMCYAYGILNYLITTQNMTYRKADFHVSLEQLRVKYFCDANEGGKEYLCYG